MQVTRHTRIVFKVNAPLWQHFVKSSNSLENMARQYSWVKLMSKLNQNVRFWIQKKYWQGLWMLGMGSSCWTVTSNCQLPKQLFRIFPSLHDEFVLPPCDPYQVVKVLSGSSQISVCSHPLMKSWGWALEPENRLGREACANMCKSHTKLYSSKIFIVWKQVNLKRNLPSTFNCEAGGWGPWRPWGSPPQRIKPLLCVELPESPNAKRKDEAQGLWSIMTLTTVFSPWLLCLIWLSCNLAPVQIERLLTSSA